MEVHCFCCYINLLGVISWQYYYYYYYYYHYYHYYY
jgi:hypothetical protein